LYSKTIQEYDSKIQFVSKTLGGMGVAELERVATAVFITQRAPAGASVSMRAEELTRRKRPIPLESAMTAVRIADRIFEEARATVQ
jgi:hypothetical protein